MASFNDVYFLKILNYIEEKMWLLVVFESIWAEKSFYDIQLKWIVCLSTYIYASTLWYPCKPHSKKNNKRKKW